MTSSSVFGELGSPFTVKECGRRSFVEADNRLCIRCEMRGAQWHRALYDSCATYEPRSIAGKIPHVSLSVGPSGGRANRAIKGNGLPEALSTLGRKTYAEPDQHQTGGPFHAALDPRAAESAHAAVHRPHQDAQPESCFQREPGSEQERGLAY
jgi:hypothetical protein